jgi:hypothetical protein
MRKKLVCSLVAMVSAAVLASPVLAAHGKAGSTIIAYRN